jgi:hypothetical protein
MVVTIVILACFLFELTMRQIAKGYRFVKDKWNIFDFVVSASAVWESGCCAR